MCCWNRTGFRCYFATFPTHSAIYTPLDFCTFLSLSDVIIMIFITNCRQQGRIGSEKKEKKFPLFFSHNRQSNLITIRPLLRMGTTPLRCAGTLHTARRAIINLPMTILQPTPESIVVWPNFYCIGFDLDNILLRT